MERKEKKSNEEDENTVEMDEEEIIKQVEFSKKTVKKKNNKEVKEDADEEDLETKRVRPKFFCCNGITKNQNRVALNVMLKEQQDQLVKFRKYAETKKWQRIHSDHYDWYMFPIEDGSQRKYNVYADDVTELKNNRKWILGYREGIEFCAKAWGWNAKCKCMIQPPDKDMGWTAWDVRLAKIIRSLWLFEETQLLHSMQEFARIVKPNMGLSYGRICLDEVFYMK
jgi:hypothetical protein